jgi:hypothetical protein
MISKLIDDEERIRNNANQYLKTTLTVQLPKSTTDSQTYLPYVGPHGETSPRAKVNSTYRRPVSAAA